jgi:hypothetical protein
MRQNVFLLYSDDTKFVADEICKNTFVNRKFYSVDNKLTPDLLLDMASSCMSKCFYLIKTDREILFPNFSFSYSIPEWDKNYMHIWNNDISVRLFNVESVLLSPNIYTDTSLESGSVDIKNIDERIYTNPIFDIIFLSYDEIYADENYTRLKYRFPRALRSHGVKGIYEAHKTAAKLAESSMFYVVDADADILTTFNFDYNPHSVDRQSVHVWHSRNPVNDLEYGYGGVKLFPTNLLLEYNGSPVDFTTSVSKSFKVIQDVSNVSGFNTDPFSAWRSGFRECAKLASKIIPNQDNTETEYRLNEWCTKGEDREFGDFAIMGAKDGMEFGMTHKDQPDMLGLINDFAWLEKRFSS